MAEDALPGKKASEKTTEEAIRELLPEPVIEIAKRASGGTRDRAATASPTPATRR